MFHDKQHTILRYLLQFNSFRNKRKFKHNKRIKSNKNSQILGEINEKEITIKNETKLVQKIVFIVGNNLNMIILLLNRLCEKECFFKLVSKCLKNQKEFGYMCVCTKFYNCFNLLELLYKLNLFGIKTFDDKILSIFGVISLSFCCICSKYYNEKDEQIFISYVNDKKEIKKNDFNDFVLDLKLFHFVCKPCFNKFYNNSFECKICKIKHKNLGKNKENYK